GTAPVFFFRAEVGMRFGHVTGVQRCALPIWRYVVAADDDVKLRDGPMRGLRISALDGAFDIVIGCDDVTHSKPHPEPVLKAVEADRKTVVQGKSRPRRDAATVTQGATNAEGH